MSLTSNLLLQTKPTYKINDSKGKGMGLFANRNIKRGELVAFEKPLLVFDLSCFSSLEHANCVLKENIQKLSESDKEKFYSLCDCHSPMLRQPMGIYQTNALPLGTDSPVGAIFPNLCRINHSCLPNVHHYWNETKGIETIYAIKDIEQNEEILTSYIDLYSDTTTRQIKLEKKFRFECKCELCSTKDEVVLKKSDLRRNKLKVLDNEIPKMACLQPEKALEKVYLMQSLIKEEGIDYEASLLGRLAYDAFSISYQTTKKNLHYWAKLTVDNFIVAQGEFNGRFKKEVYSFYSR